MVKDDEAYCQPCLSPVWDTALASHALLEVGHAGGGGRGEQALAWLKPKQVLDVVGDWAAQRPDVRPGGWAFQYANPHYPDLDDTAVVVMAMHRTGSEAGGDEAAVRRGDRAAAREWIVGLQSRERRLGGLRCRQHLPLPQQHPLLPIMARCSTRRPPT